VVTLETFGAFALDGKFCTKPEPGKVLVIDLLLQQWQTTHNNQLLAFMCSLLRLPIDPMKVLRNKKDRVKAPLLDRGDQAYGEMRRLLSFGDS
jgi:hypothetical protein